MREAGARKLDWECCSQDLTHSFSVTRSFPSMFSVPQDAANLPSSALARGLWGLSAIGLSEQHARHRVSRAVRRHVKDTPCCRGGSLSLEVHMLQTYPVRERSRPHTNRVFTVLGLVCSSLLPFSQARASFRVCLPSACVPGGASRAARSVRLSVGPLGAVAF